MTGIALSTGSELGGISESNGNPSSGPYRQSPENIAAINALLAWFTEHPREDYPHLTDGAYADFVLEQAECLGLYSPWRTSDMDRTAGPTPLATNYQPLPPAHCPLTAPGR